MCIRTLTNIIFNLLSTEDKEKNLKSARAKRYMTCKEIKIRIIPDF